MRILVLEAGGAHIEDPLISKSTFSICVFLCVLMPYSKDLPGQLGRQFGNPDYDWNYKTVPQKHADGRSFVWPNGRVLGGNSAINFFVSGYDNA